MSPYPVLDNRPIDQWKVTELKEELKRRKLITRGLKEDLIRRLDEALRAEMDNSEKEKVEEDIVAKEKAENEKEVDDGIESDLPITSKVDCSETVVPGGGYAAGQNDKNDVELDDARAATDVNEGFASSDNAVRDGGATPFTDDKKLEELSAPTCTVQTTIEVKESTVVEATVTESVHQDAEKQDNLSDNQLEDGNLKHQLESKKVPLPEDIILDLATTNSQVSEVSSNLGIQVKSDSVNNDSVSINEKNEYKGNITADNIKLELDVKPASSDVVQAGGESHPMDVEEPHESKVAVEEKEDKNISTGSNMYKNNESLELGYSEKLNIDRSSGDDSMEEDVPETKHIDSKHKKDEVGNKNERAEVTAMKEETPVDILADPVQKNIKVEKSEQSALMEKRKFDDGGNGSAELVKRRRWKSENIKISEPDGSNLTLTATLKGTLQTPTRKRNFSRSDSTVSNDAPKELVVPPPQKPPTNSLRIDRFLRPFTLKAVQELLGKTGTVESFWMDHIKTHCYVSYSTVEEAVATRNAVYNLQWPPNGGNLLVAEFVEPGEVKSRLETPAPVPVPAPAAQPSQPPPRHQAAPLKQQLPPPLPLPSPAAQERERGGHLPHPPVLSEKGDPTIVTLDVLFRKTKATPKIYYLPLSEDQVAAKLSARGKAPRQW